MESGNMESNLRKLLPPIYKGVLETDELVRVEDEQQQRFFDHMERALNDQFIQTASAAAIAAYEAVFAIVADPVAEDLEFRRERLLNRRRMRPPLTVRLLRQRLDDIFGAGKYTLRVEPDAYTLYIETAVLNQLWAQELRVTIEQIKPANIVYINAPYVGAGLMLSEGISLVELMNNYRLGTAWAMGLKPFADEKDMGVVKLAETKSIQQGMLNDVAGYIAPEITAVLLNDSYSVTDFEQKSAAGGMVTLHYNLAPGGDVPEVIEDIKVMAGDGVWTRAQVYLPVASAMTLKHAIAIKEGV